MVVFIRVTVQDIQGEKFVVQIQNDAQVLGLKLQIWEARSIAPENQRLVFAGRQLQDEETLSVAGVQDGSVIFMVQQNEQTQAITQPQQAPPVAYTPAVQNAQVVQPMNIQVQAPQPQVIVNAPNLVDRTCCCCVPLRTGAVLILVLSLIVHLSVLPGTIWVGLLGLIFDGLGIYGWWKHESKKLMMWVWFEGISLVLGAIYGVVMMIIFEVVGFHHHQHHGHGHHHGGSASGGSSSTTTHAPHKLTGQEKAIIGVLWILAILVVVAIGGYFIGAVHQYVKQLRTEETGDQVQVVNGVAYQQV